MTSSKTKSRTSASTKSTSRKPAAPRTSASASKAQFPTSASKPEITSASVRNAGAASTKPPQALASGQSPSPVVVSTNAPEETGPALAKKELIETVVLRSGIKKKDAKPVIEAMLAVLGETIAEGRDLNLKPFGKLRINRSESRSNGKVHMCRLRQPLPQAQTEQENTEEG